MCNSGGRNHIDDKQFLGFYESRKIIVKVCIKTFFGSQEIFLTKKRIKLKNSRI